MKKIFKSKTNNKNKLKKIFVLLLISFFTAIFLSKFDVFSSEKFIDLLKNVSMNEIENNGINFKGEYLINIGLSTFEDITFTKEVFKQDEIIKETIENKVYIYNTHQTEEYRTIENYNLTPTVHTASYILKDMLRDYGIGAIVEDRDLKTDLNNMGYTYRQAYKVSRSWLENLNNPNLSLYIDLHRDRINYNLSNINVNGKDYAKIMFVVGTNYDYQENMNVANGLIREIENINKDISRGVFTRFSVYNQDYNKNCVLIEVGGPESTYESVSNSLRVLASAINNYLGE